MRKIESAATLLPIKPAFTCFSVHFLALREKGANARRCCIYALNRVMGRSGYQALRRALHFGFARESAGEALADARRWIFGDAQKLKTVTMPAIHLRRLAGSAAFELSSAEIAEATAAIRKCRSAGITLHAAVDYAIKRMNLAERSKTLQEVADFVIAYKRSNGASPRHLKGMRSIFSKVCENLGERQVNEITREAIEEWQAEQDDVTLNTRISYARHFHILFSEALARLVRG